MACKCENKDKYYVTAASSPNEKKVDMMVFRDVPANTAPIEKGKTIDWAINSKKLHSVSVEIACKLKNTLDHINKNFNFAKSGVGLQKYDKYIEIVCKEIDSNVVVSDAQKCRDNIKDTTNPNYDALRKEKKDCDKKTHKWSDTKCKCRKKGNKKEKIVIDYVDGCIDPEAFNYYCKTTNNKCKDNALPEYMVPTLCDYRVEETLKHKYYLSKLDNPDPEDSINTWTGDIIISGNSSFDSPDDNSWLTSTYKPWKDYWTKKCSKIGDANIHFDPEFGLYNNLNDEIVITDLINALLKYTSDFGNHKFLKNYKILIMGGDGVNLGVVSLYKNELTLNVIGSNGIKLQGLLAYRLSKNNGSKISSTNAPNASTNDFNNYFASKTRNGHLDVTVTIDDNYIINVKGTTNESIIGLGTLLERKDKPIIGLGGLLED